MSARSIHSFSELRRRARKLGPKRVAVVMADDDIALAAVWEALQLGFAHPVLIGDDANIRRVASAGGLDELIRRSEIVATDQPAVAAAEMAGGGRADLILKGHIRTDALLHALLNKEAGLRSGRLLSDILFYEDILSGTKRLIGITDGGLNVAPNLDQKKKIIHNAIEVLHCLGFARPKIALMSATESISEALPSTAEAAALTEFGRRGGFGEADVFGPLALDNALLTSAAEAKGIRNPVAGQADCMVVPTVEAGNLLGKAVKYFAGSQCAHVVVGAKVPILIPSRVESVDDKINAIALGVSYGSR
ncbi:MAG: phosphate butyryltransferase [Alphaproteobacteria bacterium]|nr:phosphate butyryltransferase [Alphaproteobacteria bacterium]